MDLFYLLRYLFLYLKKSFLALRSQNQRVNILGTVGGFGVGLILISRDWIRRLVLLFSGRLEYCPKFAKFCQKFDGAFIWRGVITKRLHM